MNAAADTLVTIPQIAELYGVTRQAIISIKHRHPGEFPAPVIKIGTGGAYDRDEITAFLRSINWIDSEGKRGTGAGRSISDSQVSQILSEFASTGSIRKTAEAVGVSEPTVRKHLIRAKQIKCNCPCRETD
jgi:predicted DNA-binding transcriptional regulator AlpA